MPLILGLTCACLIFVYDIAGSFALRVTTWGMFVGRLLVTTIDLLGLALK